MRIGPVVLERPGPEPDRRSMEEILNEYDLVEVTDDVVVVSQKQTFDHTKNATNPWTNELGSGRSKWGRVLGGDEYNSTLAGQRGTERYDRMRRSDSAVAEALKIQKTPVLQGRWWVASADANDDRQNEIAEFVSKCLFDWMSIGWTQLMTEVLTMLDFGYSFFEKVYTFHEWRGEQRVIWQKLAPRSVFDVIEWKYDAHGGPAVVVMIGNDQLELPIPIERLLVFSYRREAGNVEGIATLREMYKHWYYKENLYKIDAIQKERHGIGIPVIVLPANYGPKDKGLAEQLGRNLRTNEQAHIVLPPFWEVYFAELKGQPVNLIESIEHHDKKILSAVMASFMMEGERADAEVMADLFFKASKHIADLVAEVINKFAIPELVDFNYMGVEDYPKLRVRHISEVTDLRTLSFTVRNLVGARVIEPDDDLEAFMRETNDLPPKDEATVREAPANATRQGPPPTGTPSAREGQDRSGEE